MLVDLFSFVNNIERYVLFLFIIGLLTLKALVDIIIISKRVKKLERLKQGNNQLEKAFICFFVAVCLLIRKDDLSSVIGNLALFVIYEIILKSVVSFCKSRFLKAFNDKEKNTNLFDRKDGIMEKSRKILSTIKVAPVPEKQNAEVEQDTLNFSHVKNILNRLKNYSLNTQEKRSVDELALAISQVENGKKDIDAKNKINDGLNCLLKIMSKYAV